MFHLIEVNTEQQKQRFCALGGIPAQELDMFPQRLADALLLLETPAGDSVARCGLWWRGTSVHKGLPTGAVGYYFAENAAAAVQLLRVACQRLAAEGCGLAVGPMDGSTWRRYRLVTEQGNIPPFFLEPTNPADWPEHFIAAAFTPLAHYRSALVTDLSRKDPLAEPAFRRFQSERGTLRALRRNRFDEELRSIHALSGECFRDSPFFTPLGPDEFQKLYGSLRDRLRPELILLAERDGKLVGLVFAMPDLLQAERGENVDTIVIKSLAVHPEAAGTGLGTLLADQCHRAAERLNYRRAIHAMMRDGNYSTRISRRTATVIRRYTLFGKRIGRGAV